MREDLWHWYGSVWKAICMSAIVDRTYEIMRKIERMVLFEVNDTVTRNQVETSLDAEFGQFGKFACNAQNNTLAIIDSSGFHVDFKCTGLTQSFTMVHQVPMGTGNYYDIEDYHCFHNLALVYLVENQIDHIITWALDFTSPYGRFSFVKIWVPRNQSPEKNELLFKLKLQMEETV